MRRREIIARFVCAIVFCTWVASASADDLLNEALDASLASGDIRSVVAMLHIGVEDTRSAKRAFGLPASAEGAAGAIEGTRASAHLSIRR